ncbi:undecaprenyldiphospho-muramoylpentapeptide beta-N-acetylglucosaminyltransferase [Persephonella atlantica]|uniref:UDP-N-acetylglucosamine--N-acetylmuramyl-(pentapeptide) pyrophosphoryl-undecaprenol N-acetylglucosamine transferase n=1 Tax=Persephonella atlantica TaxID=2699429 RepID=A0ABS1GF02_9AQUI|nr:undecaprenyldiphospho-muramoylpentapeptide beta-N-acetylglucosaminyltransferase [Persephonella atlantica]MBK3331514.1 undecaprenyldiphospho-muramoylpentapeptide beta-N-acetylglucosaminyltransferase [Persephonella atlantica]
MKIFISGGGTGGHFYPAVAVSEELKERGATIYYFGTEKGIESRKNFPADRKFLYNISGIRGKNIFSSTSSALRLIKTSFSVAEIIKKEKPDAVLCFGGYTSVPLGIASAITGTPLFLHEQNSVPSYTNRILSKFARKIFITFEYSKKFFKEDKTLLSGLPVRKQIKEDIKVKKESARKELGLENRKTVLIFGGSQGSRRLSQLGFELAGLMKNLQFLIIGGKHYTKPSNIPENVYFFEYIDRIGLAYASSDIVISRSGASSTYEILLSGKFAVFVPYPYAASDHQFFNALWLYKKGLCEIMREESLSTEKIKSILEKTESQYLKDIEKDLKNLSIYNSEKIIVDRIFDELD